LYHKLLIIGGGASGLMAALTCKDMGVDIAVIEGSDRVGKKILTTGNGRCNISNEGCLPSRYHSENLGFFTPVLESFTYKDTEEFFSSLGLPLVTLEEGKMFPMSLQASSVLDILRFAIEDRDIPLYLNSKVKEIKSAGNGFKILTLSNETYECEKVILACGGKSAPATGSDGSGFDIARKLGHTIIPPAPSLVQLKLDYNYLKGLAGIKFNGFAEVFVNKCSMQKEFGEVLFTEYGISGPPILQLSRIVSRALLKGEIVELVVDLMPTMKPEKLMDFLENRWGTFSYRSVNDSLIGVINKKLIPILLKECGLTDIHMPCYNLQWNEKKSIASHLKSWCFKVSGTNSFKDSQVTSGGIDTRSVNPETLESNIVKGLYFCGEILDVDGDCGGFNLQWAWSSAFAAAKNACKS
jgi:predicted Rossmann fold flavoprotein